jgi:hypothetical protein
MNATLDEIFNLFDLQIDDFSLELLHTNLEISPLNLFRIDFNLWFAVS